MSGKKQRTCQFHLPLVMSHLALFYVCVLKVSSFFPLKIIFGLNALMQISRLSDSHLTSSEASLRISSSN